MNRWPIRPSSTAISSANSREKTARRCCSPARERTSFSAVSALRGPPPCAGSTGSRRPSDPACHDPHVFFPARWAEERSRDPADPPRLNDLHRPPDERFLAYCMSTPPAAVRSVLHADLRKELAHDVPGERLPFADANGRSDRRRPLFRTRSRGLSAEPQPALHRQNGDGSGRRDPCAASRLGVGRAGLSPAARPENRSAAQGHPPRSGTGADSR